MGKEFMNPLSSNEAVERIYREWDDALSRLDCEKLLSLYAPDATLESPLIPHLLKCDSGICRGRDEIRKLIEELARTQPEVRKFYRAGYLTDGKKIFWEYPRATPDGDQMDFAEVMEIKDGLIQRHRVYWGWFGVGVIQRDEHHRKKQ
jgi:ketosteroid isomerase-like protein